MDAQLEEGGRRVPSLLQSLGRLPKTLPEATGSAGGHDTARSCSPGTPALYDSSHCAATTAASSLVPEGRIPQLRSISSCSVDPIMLSLVDPAASRHGIGTGTYAHLIQPLQEQATAYAHSSQQPSFLFCGDFAAGPASCCSAPPPFLSANPYSADPAVLASILSILERPPVVASNSIPHDIPHAKVAAEEGDAPAKGHRGERPSLGPGQKKIQPAPHTSAGVCPHLSSEPEEAEAGDGVGSKGADAPCTHQRQHLLTTSLGPGAYFRARKRRPYRHESFPEKLHRMLVEAERDGRGDVVGFTRSGLAFEIRRVDEFLSDVIPDFFRHKSISSFRRQLSMYGFKRVKDSGPDHGAYRHELFRRDQPLLCRQMKRVTELELILPDDPTADFRN